MHQQTLLAAFALTRRRALLATGALLFASSRRFFRTGDAT